MQSGPLAPLSTNQYDIGNLVYPSDLGSSRKGHWITFQISVPAKSYYSKSNVTPMVNQGIGGLRQSSTSIVGDNTIARVVNGVVKAVSNIPEGSGPLWKWTVSPGATKLMDVISLYTPDTVSISQHAKYNAESLTDALGAFGYVGASTATVASALGIGNGAGDSVGVAAKGLGMEAAGGFLGGSTGVGAGLKTIGQALNPQMEVLFKEIDFRTFQFDFLFTPKSEAEAATVREIIKKFKFHHAPEIDKETGRYYIVPSVFNIEYYFEGNTNDNLHKFALSALETVAIDYSPQGWVTHDDGMPVQTRMTLQFKEMEVMTKQRIEQGY